MQRTKTFSAFSAGLLLVISTAFAHDLVKKTFKPDLSERSELGLARIGAGVAVVLFGDHPPTGTLSHSWPESSI